MISGVFIPKQSCSTDDSLLHPSPWLDQLTFVPGAWLIFQGDPPPSAGQLGHLSGSTVDPHGKPWGAKTEGFSKRKNQQFIALEMPGVSLD